MAAVVDALEVVVVDVVGPGPGWTARVQLEAHEPDGASPVMAVKWAVIRACDKRPA